MTGWNPFRGAGSSERSTRASGDPAEHNAAERMAIERDRDLAWDLYYAKPTHRRISQLTQSVLEREPSFTGMIILTARHLQACGELDEARRLLKELIGRQDRQFINALRELRDLESSDDNHVEALRLAETVLREAPEPSWVDRMEHGYALVFTSDPEGGWQAIDEAVELCARVDTDDYNDALAQRAVRLLSSSAPPERFLPAAEEAIAADPSEPLLSTALAYAYMYHYRVEEAEEILRRVLREDPTDETAQLGMTLTRAFLNPIEQGIATMDQLRNGGLGELVWRMLSHQLHGTGLNQALAALTAVMPSALAASLHKPLAKKKAYASEGSVELLQWRNGQTPGTGSLWGTDEPFRLMTASEVDAVEKAIKDDREAWPQWDPDNEYYTLLLTNDSGAYLFEGAGGRLIRRAVAEADREVAPSFPDWVWDRVVAFGGSDPRPGR